MRKFIILIAMLLASLHSHAQLQLEDFYQPGATWCEEKVVGVGFGTYYIAAKYEWRVDVDTTINSIAYHKIQNYGRTYGGLRTSNDSVFFYRTDTTNYFQSYGPSLGAEVLLYKFDLQQNDMISWRYAGNNTITNVATTQLTNGQVVNQYWFDSYESWVYGIGGTRGLFDAYIAGTGPYYMRTYTSPNVAFSFPFSYPVQHDKPPGTNGPFRPCFPTSVGDVVANEGGFNVYPNPVTGESFRLITQAAVTQIWLTDVTGKLIYQMEELASGYHELSLPGTQGIYLLKAQFADGSIQTRKLIRQ